MSSLAVNYVYVALGGALGACSRYSLNLLLFTQHLPVPLATLVANVTGSLLAGFLTIVFMDRVAASGSLHLLMVVGFLGGFTTFSAFSVETLRLASSGSFLLAASNVGLNILGSLLAVAAGAYSARWYLGS